MNGTAHTFSNDYINAYHTELRADRSNAPANEAVRRRGREKKQ